MPHESTYEPLIDAVGAAPVGCGGIMFGSKRRKSVVRLDKLIAEYMEAVNEKKAEAVGAAPASDAHQAVGFDGGVKTARGELEK